MEIHFKLFKYVRNNSALKNSHVMNQIIWLLLNVQFSISTPLFSFRSKSCSTVFILLSTVNYMTIYFLTLVKVLANDALKIMKALTQTKTIKFKQGSVRWQIHSPIEACLRDRQSRVMSRRNGRLGHGLVDQSPPPITCPAIYSCSISWCNSSLRTRI